MGLGEVGFELGGDAEFGDGLSPIALAREAVAQKVVGVGVIVLEANRGAVLGHGRIVLAQAA
jgi:hypothetical protein